MKRWFAVLLVSLVVVPVVTRGAEPVELKSSITAVTVYADRALVTREGKLSLPAGVSQVAIPELPAWIDSGSIRAMLSPRDGAEIVEIQVQKEFRAKPDGDEMARAEAAVQEIRDRMQLMQDELVLLEARRKQVEGLAQFDMTKVSQDAVTRDIPVSHYREIVEFVGGEREEIMARRREIAREQRELEPERVAREKRLAELQRLVRLEFSSIILTIETKKAGTLQLTAKYMTPGATWQPVHEMRVDSGNRVRFVSFARVSQTTGENWNGAQLSVSTQSPGKAMNIPKLDSLLVGNVLARPIAQAMQVVDTFDVANNDFIGNNLWMNSATGLIKGERGKNAYQKNFKAQMLQQRESLATFERLQERGTTAIFNAADKKAVRSDGTPVRLVIGTQTLESTPMLVAVPELSLNTTRTLNLANKGEQPILPGQVSLFLDGAFIGTTTVDFVGTGEEFSMFAGLADEVKIARVLDHDESQIERGRRTTEIRAAFVTTLENLSDEAITVKLVDRIPVSDDKSIKVSDVDLDPKVEPGDDGLLSWEIMVAPKAKETVLVSYTVEYPTNIAQMRSQMRQMASPAQAIDAAEMLIDLEAQF